MEAHQNHIRYKRVRTPISSMPLRRLATVFTICIDAGTCTSFFFQRSCCGVLLYVLASANGCTVRHCVQPHIARDHLFKEFRSMLPFLPFLASADGCIVRHGVWPHIARDHLFKEFQIMLPLLLLFASADGCVVRHGVRPHVARDHLFKEFQSMMPLMPFLASADCRSEKMDIGTVV